MNYSIKVSEGIEYRKVGGCVKRLVNPKTTESVNIGTSVCYLNPGEENTRHRHENEEVYFVVQGEGKMTIEEETIRLGKYLSVYIPANAWHWTINDGEEPLVLHCSLSPPPIIEE